jgi:hypothetical protein
MLFAICDCSDFSNDAPSGSAMSSSAVSLPSDRAAAEPRESMYDLDMSTFSEEPKPIFVDVDDSKHLAPFMHGDDAHSFTSVPQLKPTYPVSQVQEYTPIFTGFALMIEEDSVQTALFMQGNEAHSFVSTAQLIPVKPSGHLHEYEF